MSCCSNRAAENEKKMWFKRSTCLYIYIVKNRCSVLHILHIDSKNLFSIENWIWTVNILWFRSIYITLRNSHNVNTFRKLPKKFCPKNHMNSTRQYNFRQMSCR